MGTLRTSFLVAMRLLVFLALTAASSQGVFARATPARSAAKTSAAPSMSSGDTSFVAVCARLRQLGYLPMRAATAPGARRVTFDFAVPQILQRLADALAWNRSNPFVRGAVIYFARVNGLQGVPGARHGVLSTRLRRDILAPNALAAPKPWVWVLVNKNKGVRDGETLRVWQAPSSCKGSSCARHPQNPAGAAKRREGYVFETAVNTGVLGQTPDGTFPIWARLARTRMTGVFPHQVSWSRYEALLEGKGTSREVGLVDGNPVQWVAYDDPGILWVSYFDGGRGLHYFARARYGFAQSAGCVEEPLQAARVVYGLVHYGVPVSVVSSLRAVGAA